MSCQYKIFYTQNAYHNFCFGPFWKPRMPYFWDVRMLLKVMQFIYVKNMIKVMSFHWKKNYQIWKLKDLKVRSAVQRNQWRLVKSLLSIILYPLFYFLKFFMSGCVKLLMDQALNENFVLPHWILKTNNDSV